MFHCAIFGDLSQNEKLSEIKPTLVKTTSIYILHRYILRQHFLGFFDPPSSAQKLCGKSIGILTYLTAYSEIIASEGELLKFRRLTKNSPMSESFTA